MYCQSCQTKLSPRDTSCPTCGRRARQGSRSLGEGNSNGDSQREYPLPPASSVDPESSGSDLSDSGSASVPKARGARKARASRPAPVTKERRPERRKSASPDRSSDGGGSPLAARPADVRSMLVEDPSLIEDGLEVYAEDGEVIGAGFSTAVGEIDVLARDDAGGWVVISVPDRHLGKDIVSDLLQRMGWIRRHLGKSGEEVRGIVLLDELPDDLGYAAAAVADSVEFKIYQVQLSLEAVIV